MVAHTGFLTVARLLTPEAARPDAPDDPDDTDDTDDPDDPDDPGS
jgi:hypothetical protein